MGNTSTENRDASTVDNEVGRIYLQGCAQTFSDSCVKPFCCQTDISVIKPKHTVSICPSGSTLLMLLVPFIKCGRAFLRWEAVAFGDVCGRNDFCHRLLLVASFCLSR